MLVLETIALYFRGKCPGKMTKTEVKLQTSNNACYCLRTLGSIPLVVLGCYGPRSLCTLLRKLKAMSQRGPQTTLDAKQSEMADAVS